MSWTIVTPSGGGAFADYGISGAVRSLRSHAVDTFTFTQAVDVGAPRIAEYGDTVSIFYSGVRKFVGICTKPMDSATGGRECVEYEISGAWWYLENTVLQAPWKIVDGSSINKGRVILGISAMVEATNIGQDIAGIFDWAIAAGAPIALGLHAIGAFAPPKEALDVMCSEAIRSRLKYAPDAVSWVDYTGEGNPTINFAYQGDLSAYTRAMTAISAEGFRCMPRKDLVPKAVVIKYEITSTVTGEHGTSQGLQIHTDAEPDESDGAGVGNIVTTIPLTGSDSKYATAKLRVIPRPATAALPPGSSATHAMSRFVQTMCPDLASVDKVMGDTITPDLTFYKLASGNYCDFKLANPTDADTGGPFYYEDPDDVSTKVHLDLSLTNCLVVGSILPWMEPATKGQVQTMTFKCSWKNGGAVEGYEEDGSIGQEMSVNFTATNAASQTYSSLTSYTEGTPVPSGLAAALYASLQTLQYEGQASWTEDECSSAAGPGKVLNVSGARTEYAGMNALVQQSRERLDTGETQVHFGPPTHLAPQDCLELMRAGRPQEWDTGNRGTNAGSRASGLV